MMRLCITQRSILILSAVFLLLTFLSTHSLATEEDTAYSLPEKLPFASQMRPVNQTTAGKEPSIFIRLSTAHFDPLKSIPASQARLSEVEMEDAGQIDYFILQFTGPIEKAWKSNLEAMGIEILDYVPDFAYIIRMDSNKINPVNALPYVRWLGLYQPSYKLSRAVLDKVLTTPEATVDPDQGESATSLVELRVTAFPGESVNELKAKIASSGGVIVDTAQTSWKTSFEVNISPDKIGDLASIPGIKWVEPKPVWKLFNNTSTDIMNIRDSRNNHGLYGASQTIGICDTGLDQGVTNPVSLHDDFEDGAGTSRVTVIFDRLGDGSSDVNSGHGTHVAGSVLGNGFLSGCTPTDNSFPSTCFAGTAPKAKLVFQAVEDNATGYLNGLPLDLNELFSQAEGAGADLHTNSWGSSTSGMYTSDSEDVDEYMWNNPDFLILFAAGNDGIDKDGDGVIDLYSTGSPGTAKNCITVGATEGNRPSGAGADYKWGEIWPNDYSASPIFADHLSDDPNGMVAFSSRGPTIDGRYKPDLVAPGSNILSTRSSLASGSGWGVFDGNYIWNGGTSMATPLTAGAAALMREYLMDVKGFSNPSAALIKAALLSGAEDISPGQYGTGATQEIPDSPAPNNITGWGRVNIGTSVYPANPFSRFYMDERKGINTGESKNYTINVSSSNTPIKLNLVWTDYPGSPVSQGALVNDLDLQVTDPSLIKYYPDGASQKPAVNQLAYDNDNSGSISPIALRAIRFTPSTYPANLESATFYFYNPNPSTDDVNVVVYDDDDDGGLPGTELFRKTLTYVPSGWITVGVTGVVISAGDFYIAIEKPNADQRIVVDGNSNPYSRSYWYNDTSLAWELSSHTAYIRANVRGLNYSTSFDRVNNTVGLTLNNPKAGKYHVNVRGYNVPFGSQPYALVVSCEQCSVNSNGFPWPMFMPAIKGGL
jgi:hypothetical protein